MFVSAVLLTACGTASQYAASSGSARFEDGIYGSSPSFMSRETRNESQEETDALIEKTKASRIYLFGEKKDTVVIPENMSAKIQFDRNAGNTIVTVGENPYDWQNNIDPWLYFAPYSIGSSMYRYRYFDPWYHSSWFWNTWSYTPWVYSGWHDPFYWGGWYDPWYYGYGGWYGGWYDPWYGYMHPHYCGWYGGWDPYWGHHHHHNHYPHYSTSGHKREYGAGSRREATGTRVNGSSSARRGTAFASRVSSDLKSSSINASGAGSSSSRPSRVVTSVRPASGNSTVPASARPATSRTPVSTGQPTAVQSYRKPRTSVSINTGTSSSSTTERQPSSVSRSTATSSSSSSEYRSSRSSRSSYSSPSSSRSSYSSPSSSRSSYSSGSSSSRSSYSSGGASRSGGYSGGRR